MDVSSLSEGVLIFDIESYDPVNNLATTSAQATYNRSLPALSIDQPVTADDIINAFEQDNVPIRGKGEPGALVTVIVTDTNGNKVSQDVTVDSEGNWSVDSFSVRALQPGLLTIDALQTVDGDSVVAEHTVLFNPTSLYLTLDAPIAGDDVVNMDEKSQVMITGTTDLSGEVIVTISDSVMAVTRTVPVVNNQCSHS